MEITIPVTFILNDDKLPDLHERAAVVDDHIVGQHQVTYTDEQALIVCFHDFDAFNDVMGPDKPIIGYHHADQFPDNESTQWVDATTAKEN